MGARGAACLGALAVALLASLAACNVLLDAPDFSAGRDAGVQPSADAGREAAQTKRDAGHDATVDGTSPRRDAGRDSGRRADSAGDSGDAWTPGAAVAVSAGSVTPVWCAVTAAGDLLCWGDNEVGQLGNGTTTPSTSPVKVMGMDAPVVQVSVGDATVCAVTAIGGVWCWGLGLDGELGNGTMTEAQLTPAKVTGLERGVEMVSLGGGVSCALKQDGSVWCWGYGGGDGLGNAFDAGPDAGAADGLVPVEVSSLTSGVTWISVGSSDVCVVQRGAALCWGGADENGSLGDGTLNESSVPQQVTGLTSGVAAVTAGYDFACALTTAGGVECWGDGSQGALGDGNFSSNPSPVQVTGLMSGVKVVSAGTSGVCALMDDGTATCWGLGSDGELGTGTTTYDGSVYGASSIPVRVKGLSSPGTTISTGDAPCVVTTTGGVDCWGFTSELALTPVPVADFGTNLRATSVSVGGGPDDSEGFACATGPGAVGCWGANNAGQLAAGNFGGNSSTPYFANGLIMAVAPSCGMGGDYACAVQSGLARCWGANESGELGNGSTTPSDQPVTVSGLSAVAQISAGATSACAVTTAGAAYCWGDNSYGQLGNGSTTNSPVPVPVHGLTSGVTAVAVGQYYACALLAAGTIECWGNNTYGQLGNGTTMLSTTPGLVSGIHADASATSIAAGWWTACAVAGGGVLCWGDNTFYELGNDSEAFQSAVPVSVVNFPDGGVASKVAVGQVSACAVVAGSALCWGVPPALGNGSLLSAELATPVVGLTSGVTDVAVGVASGCAVVNGAVDCWGWNPSGQLGNGGAVNELLATPVAGFPYDGGAP